jgi:type II secretion system protein J
MPSALRSEITLARRVIAFRSNENVEPERPTAGSPAAPNGNRGFTLVEILLAVALSALLMTIVYWTYFSINRSIDAATENQEALETGRMLTELIKRDIRGISPGRYGVTGKTEVIEGRVYGDLEFVTTAALDSGPVRLRKVGYALVVNEKGERIFIRRESKNLDGTSNDTPSSFELSRIVNGFRVEFYNGSEWIAAWDSAGGISVPKQIRVTIDVSDAKGKTRRFTAEESIQSAS